jgi:hypothetical protein
LKKLLGVESNIIIEAHKHFVVNHNNVNPQGKFHPCCISRWGNLSENKPSLDLLRVDMLFRFTRAFGRTTDVGHTNGKEICGG